MLNRYCAICENKGEFVDATVDTKTIWGPWAYLCDKHFKLYGTNVKGLFTELKDVKE